MEDMTRARPPYLQRHVTRHGKVLWYVRIGKGPRTPVQGEYGSAEFMEAYRAALNGRRPAAPVKAAPNSLAWLVARYRETLAWSRLSPATRRQRDNILKRVLAGNGAGPMNGITKRDVRDGIDKRRDTPAAARHFLDTLRGLFEWAVEAEHVTEDPTAGIKGPEKTGDGFHVWTEEECRQFEDRWPRGTRERLAFDLLLYTGLRRGDAVKLGRQHVRNGVARIRTEKSGGKVEVAIRILPPLAESIAAAPCGELSFIAGERGKPMTKESFGNWFRKACQKAGVPGSAHGLRKAGATRAAEAGATEHELMALFGWTSPRMAALYTRQAQREKLAGRASDKIAEAQNWNVLSPNLGGDAPNLENNDPKTEAYGGRKN